MLEHVLLFSVKMSLFLSNICYRFRACLNLAQGLRAYMKGGQTAGILHPGGAVVILRLTSY